MDQIINLNDYWALNLEQRLKLAQRDFPGMKILYVGRQQDGFPKVESPLANPNWLSKKDGAVPAKRKANIDAYRLQLWKKIKSGDKTILDALAEIDDNTILACWCAPLPCHCNVIWNAWHWLKSKERVRSQEPV